MSNVQFERSIVSPSNSSLHTSSMPSGGPMGTESGAADTEPTPIENTSTATAKTFTSLPLHRAGGQSGDDVPLQEHEQHQHRHHEHEHGCCQRRPVAAVDAFEHDQAPRDRVQI